MSFVGLNIDKCVELKTHLDEACRDLNAHANIVQGLLDQAGITSCKAPAELREIAAWADYRSRDLQKRIDRARAADSGTHPGARFGGNVKKATEEGIAEAKRIKDLLDRRASVQEINAEVARAKAKADDPAYASALVRQLGSRFLDLLNGISNDSVGSRDSDSLDAIATLLATVSRTADPDNKLDKKALQVLKDLLKNADAAQLATLLKHATFAPEFTAKAAKIILTTYTRRAMTGAYSGPLAESYRQAAIHALELDPEASFQFVRDSLGKDDFALRSLLEESADTHIISNAFERYQGRPPEMLERMIHFVNDGVPLTGGAKQDLARAFAPAIVDGRVLGTHRPMNPRLAVSYDALLEFMANLMKNDGARQTLTEATGEYLKMCLAHTLPTMMQHLNDPHDVNYEPWTRLGGETLFVLQQAYIKALDNKKADAEAEAEAYKAMAHIIGAILLDKAPAPTGTVVDLAADNVVDALMKDNFDKLELARNHGPTSTAENELTVGIVAVLAKDPKYAESLKADNLLDGFGNLRSDASITDINTWVAKQDGLYASINALLGKFHNWAD